MSLFRQLLPRWCYCLVRIAGESHGERVPDPSGDPLDKVLVLHPGGEGGHPAQARLDRPVHLVVRVDKDKVAALEICVEVGQVEQGSVVESRIRLLVHVQVPVLVVRGRRVSAGQTGEEGGVCQVQRRRRDVEVGRDRRSHLFLHLAEN